MEELYKVSISAEGTWDEIRSELLAFLADSIRIKYAMEHDGYMVWEDQAVIARIDPVEVEK